MKKQFPFLRALCGDPRRGPASARPGEQAGPQSKWLYLFFIAFFLSSSLFAATKHFPVLRSAAKTLKTKATNKEAQSKLRDELDIERALWEDEVKRETQKLKASRSTGAAQALARLTQIDAEVRARLDSFASALEKNAPLPSNVLDPILAPAVSDWPIRSGSGPVPSRNPAVSRKPHLEEGLPSDYSKPPSSTPESGQRVPQKAAAQAPEAPDAAVADSVSAKAVALNHEPVALYRFVLNEIRSEHYFGSMKSAETVLASGSGNDADQAALLRDLFLASGFHARLVWGVEELPVDSLYNHFQVGTVPVLERLLSRSGIPWEPVVQGGRPVAYRLERVWCEAWLPFTNFRGLILDKNGSTWAPLDPEWKTMTPRITRRVLTEMGLNADTFLASYLSGSLCTGDPQTAAGCAPARDVLAAQVDAYLAAQHATDTYASLGGSRAIEAQTENVLPSSLPGKIVSINGVYLNLPDSLQHRLRIQATHGSATLLDATVNVADLSGREAVLWFAPATDADEAIVDSYGGDLWSVPPYLLNVTPQLLAKGVEVAKGTAGIGMGGTFELSYTLMAPSGDQTSFTNDVMAGVPVALGIGAGKQAYAMAGVEPANTVEILSKLANDYLDPKSQFEEELAAITGLTVIHRFPSVVGISAEVEAVQELGLIRSLQWKGVTVDADIWGAQAEGGDAAATKAWTTFTSLNASTLERKVFESYGVASISADKAILLARLQSIPIVHIDQSNVAAQLAALPYSAAIKGEIQSWINAGGVADIPQSPLNYIEWTGTGYILTDPSTGEAKYQLAGGLSGGITVVPIEDVLNAISQFLSKIGNLTVNTNPDQAVRLVTPGFINGVPIQTVASFIPYPLVVIALDAQGRRVAGRPVTFNINGKDANEEDDAQAGFEDPQGVLHPDTVTVYTNSFGEATVKVKVGRYTGWKTSVYPEYLKLNETDAHDTLLGLYQIDVTSGDLNLDEPVWTLSSPYTPAKLTVSGYPNPAPAFTVLEPAEVHVTDVFGNPIANAVVHHQWSLVLPGTLSPGFLSTEFIVQYLQEHPWPTSEEVQNDLQDELDVLSDTSGYTYAYPALGDGVVPGVLALSTFTASTGTVSRVVDIHILGFPTYTVQAEPRVQLYGEWIEAYGLGESVLGDARITIRQIEVAAQSTTATWHYVRDAQVTFKFPGTNPVLLQGTNGDTYDAPYPPLTTASAFVYKFDAIFPGVSLVNQNGPTVWAVQPEVLPNPGEKGFLVAKGGANCSQTQVRSQIQPAGYLNRTNLLLTQTLGGLFSMEIPDPHSVIDIHNFPVAILDTPGVVGGNIESGLIDSSEISLPVTVKMQRPWLPAGSASLQAGRRFDVDEVSIQIEPQLPSACMLAGDISPFDVVVKTVSPVIVDLSDWNVTLAVRDAANPGAPVYAIPVSLTDLDRRGSVDEALAQHIAAMIDPVISGQAHLTTDGCLLPVLETHLYGPQQPPLHVEIKQVYLRSVHRSCMSRKVPSITLPGLPQGSSWTVKLNGIAVPDPNNNIQWAPGTYAAPYPQSANSDTFTVEAITDCPGGQATLHWDGEIQVETAVQGGLPLAHPIVDGVDASTGSYHLMRQDLTRPGLAGGLSLVRSFSNTGNLNEQGLGNGWGFNYELTLNFTLDCQVWMASDIEGTPYEFAANGSPFPGYHGTLETAAGGGRLLTTKAGIRYLFLPAPDDTNKYLLKSITDPFGNSIVIEWQQLLDRSGSKQDRVKKVTNPAGRSLLFNYELRTTTVTGPDGEKFVYDKDVAGFLVSAKRYQKQGEEDVLLWAESYTYKEFGQADYSNLDTFIDRDGRQTKIFYYSLAQDPDYKPAPVGNQATVAASVQYRHVKELWQGLDPQTQGPMQKTRFAYDMSTLGLGTMTAKVTNGENETTTYTMGEEGQPLEVKIDALNQTTHTEWDLTQVVKTKETDALGRETQYIYNTDGDQTDVIITNNTSYPLTDGDGNPIAGVTTHRDYDSHWHKVTHETTSDGLTVDYILNSSNGSITKKMETGQQDSREEVYSYSSKGELLTDENFEAATTTYSNYDNLGNARHVDLPMPNNFIDRTFDARGRKLSESSSKGRVETWEYNDLDQVTAHTVTDTRGATDFVREKWNTTVEGLLVEHSDTTGLVETYAYDSAGRKQSQTIATGRRLSDGRAEEYKTAWTYDGASRIKTRTDSDGSIHTFVYDEAGRVLSESIGVKRIYSQQLDAAGNVRYRTDHRGATTEFHYDGLYRKIQEIAPQVLCANPNGSKSICSPEKSWLFDRAGRVTKETDGNGNDRVLIYDHFKRVGQETRPLGHTTVRTYDKMDRLKTEERQPEALLVEKDYDDLGRGTSERRKLLQQNKTYETTYLYDDSGQTVKVTNPEGEVQLVTNDSLGHVKSVAIDPAGLNLISSYLYDGHGKQRKMTDANGNSTTVRNDALGRPFQSTSPLLQIENAQGGNDEKTAVGSREYDFAGRVLLEIDPVGARVAHTYDPLGRELTRTFNFQASSEPLRSWAYHDDAPLTPPDRISPTNPSVTETDGRGNPIQHWYDGMGREVLTADQNGHASQLIYDRNSNLASKINRRGFEQRAAYDALNRKTETRWVGGSDGQGSDDLIETTTYDDIGHAVTNIDRMGFYHIQTQDEAGRKIEERVEEHDQTGPIHTITNGRWSYDGVDRVVDEFDAKGNKTHFTYDAAGRNDITIQAVGTPEAYEVTTIYDKMDHVKEVDDCEGRLLYETYDKGYRLLSEQDKMGNVTGYGWNVTGDRVSTTDGENHKTKYVYDSRHRLTRVTDPEGNATQYGYDGNNNRTFVLNGENHRTEWEYDGVNRVTKEKRLRTVDPAAITQMTYDEEGNRIAMTDAAQQDFTYEFDALGRETKAFYPFSASSPDQTLVRIEHDYDDLDRVTHVRQIRKIGGSQTTELRSLDWDFAGRQTRETDAHGVIQDYGYDDNGNRTSTITTIPQQTGRNITYTYDHRNRLKTLDDAGVTTYNYRCRGEKLDNVVRSDGNIETYTYDNADRLTNKTVEDGASLLLSYTYGYDRSDWRTSQTENHGQGGEPTTYTYYSNGSLKTVTYPDGKNVAYVYDHAGNRTRETTKATTSGPIISDKTSSYNDLEELTGITDSVTQDSTAFTYDANGNRTSESQTTGGVTKVTASDYTSRNHLREVKVDGTSQALFAYDDAGRRIQKNAELEHWDGASLIAETDAASGALLRDYTHGLDLLRETIGNQQVQTYTDVLGSVGMLSAGTDTAHYRYDAFGTFRTSSHPGGDCSAESTQLACNNNLTYTGHLFDAESGLFYFNARYYDPTSGRFTSRDPASDLHTYSDWFGRQRVTRTVRVGTFVSVDILSAPRDTSGAVVATESGIQPLNTYSDGTESAQTFSGGWSTAANAPRLDLNAWSGNRDSFAVSTHILPQYMEVDSDLSVIDPTNPNEWMSYSYAFNSPVNYTDPMGLFTWEDVRHGASAFGGAVYGFGKAGVKGVVGVGQLTYYATGEGLYRATGSKVYREQSQVFRKGVQQIGEVLGSRSPADLAKAYVASKKQGVITALEKGDTFGAGEVFGETGFDIYMASKAAQNFATSLPNITISSSPALATTTGAIIETGSGLTITGAQAGPALTGVAQTTLLLASHKHHSDPKFLGGEPKQPLTELEEGTHRQLHQEMNEFLKTKVDEFGNDMMPRKGNSGETIRRNFSREELLAATAEFYRSHTGAAADDFFKQHPGLK